MTIINESEAFGALRGRAAERDAPSEVKLQSVLHYTLSEVGKFIASFIVGAEDFEVALFVGEEYCWFFGENLAIRSSIRTATDPGELTYYVPSRDFGAITIGQGNNRTSVTIAARSGAAAMIELAGSGSDAKALESALPFLFGRGGNGSNATRKA